MVVTAAGPHSGDDDVTKRFGDLLLALQVHVRFAVGFLLLAAVLVAWVWREGTADRATDAGSPRSPSRWSCCRSASASTSTATGCPGRSWPARLHGGRRVGRHRRRVLGVARPALAGAGAPGYGRREATLWQGTQRTESGSARSRPSGISEPQSTQIP